MYQAETPWYNNVGSVACSILHHVVDQLKSGIRVLPYTASISKLFSIDGNTWKFNKIIIHCINFLTLDSQSLKPCLSSKINPLSTCVYLRLNPISSQYWFSTLNGALWRSRAICGWDHLKFNYIGNKLLQPIICFPVPFLNIIPL